MAVHGVSSCPVGNRWDTGRTESFSDGVFAFAITLLVLDIHVPASGFNHLWRAIADQWPSYLGYATSFLTVGGIWLVHHGIFRRVQYANRRVMQVNLLLLMAVAFLPFPTSLVAEAIRHADAERAAVIFYGASLLVISLLYSALWSAVASDRTLLKPDVSKKEVDAIARATTPKLGFYLAVILLAFIAPKVAAFGYLVIAIVALVRARGDRAPTTTTPGSA
ncbi:MAG TPA: TMEM175 family protein [Solirubrobacteraceae bacterium]|nr:TMEM175 family protein [Solirubrobacteraceae bacterium]